MAEDVRADDEAQIQNVAAKHLLAAPSFPKAANGCGFTGSRFWGHSGAFPVTDAKSYDGHVELSRHLPSPLASGFQALP